MSSGFKAKRILPAVFAVATAAALGACANNPPMKPSEGHIKPAETAVASTNIPKLVQQASDLPKPQPSMPQELISVSVVNVPAQELLFALARDANLNLDIHPGIQGRVSINAINQTLPQILNRISKQIDMRFEIDGPNLVVMRDTPFLRNYKIDYVNVARDASGSVSINTQIASTGSAGGGGGNNSSTSITNTAKNRFWETLEKNIKDILQETDKEQIITRQGAQSAVATPSVNPAAGAAVPGSATATPQIPATLAASTPAASGNQGDAKESRILFASSVMSSPEAGLISVRATARQHEKIQEFIDQVMVRANRQVLIEVTIAEVTLSSQYQQGIDWTLFRSGATGARFVQSAAGMSLAPPTGSSLPTGSALVIDRPNLGLANFTATVKLLESFGNVRVLSSPKINVINNQTALLKVVDNKVYFTIKSDTIAGTGGSAAVTTTTTTPNTVSVGFVMSVTPQISESGSVLLNVRPTISRIFNSVKDPNPALTIDNNIPEIQTREMESVLRVESGEIAIMGGLIQDGVNNLQAGIPGAAELPGIGNLFKSRNETSTKTELVIFLRPVVVKNSAADTDYRAYRNLLPDDDFFTRTINPLKTGQAGTVESARQ